MNTDKNGILFLIKCYKDLPMDKGVMHNSKYRNNEYVSMTNRVDEYLKKLEKSEAALKGDSGLKKMLLNMYYDKYVIKEKDIPSSYVAIAHKSKQQIIDDQRKSLENWLMYLTDENAKYPIWAKYWVFHGMLKIGTYDESNDTYGKRSKKTLAPFIEANPEIIAKCIELVSAYVSGQNISDSELYELLESGNFKKIYTSLIAKNNASKSSDNSGIWVTYYHESEKDAEAKEAKGIEPEYLKLFKDLQGYNTGWCTAGSLNMAKDQICGLSFYTGGNFYVYYTKDENGEYKIPRIAIRMDDYSIGEIRGIEKSQNLEEGLEDVVSEKLKTLNLEKSEIEEKLSILNDLKTLTRINQKNTKKENLTKEEIRFLYELDKRIKDFGWNKDERTNKIKSSRKIEEDARLVPELVQFDGLAIKNVPTTIENYETIAMMAVTKNGFALKYIPPITKNYAEIAKIAVRTYGLPLQYVPINTKDYYEIAKIAVKASYHALKYVPTSIENYKEIAIEAVKHSFMAMKLVPRNVECYIEIATAAIQYDYLSISYIATDIENYKELAIKAVNIEGTLLSDIPTTIDDYKEIAIAAVESDWEALKYVPYEIDGYEEIAIVAVRKNKKALKFVPQNLQEKILQNINFLKK